MKFAATLASLVCLSLAAAQPGYSQGIPNRLDSFNIDFDQSSLPPTTYGGAPDLRGNWNSVPPGASNQGLVRRFLLPPNPITDNSDIDVTGAVIGTNPINQIPAPHTELFRDYIQSSSSFTIVIDELPAGTYVLTTYHWMSNGTTPAPFVYEDDSAGVQIQQFPYGMGSVNCGPTFPGPNVQQVSMISGEIMLNTPDSMLRLTFPKGGFINGMQLVPVYQGSSTGCIQTQLNSLGQSPSIYATSGENLNPVLVVGALPGILPNGNGAGILCWVSDTNLSTPINYTCPNFQYFIGERCIGPDLFRVGDPNAPGGIGVPQIWGAYSVEIPLASFPATIPTTPGSTLRFQFVYRDQDSAFVCTPPFPPPPPPVPAVARWTDSHTIIL